MFRRSLGLFLGALARPFLGGIGCLVCLHRVLPEAERSRLPERRALEITPGSLRELLGWVRRRGLEVIALDEVPARLARPRGAKFVCFTFDDGYRDNLALALPIFRELRTPFTVFATTDFVAGRAWPAWYEEAADLLLTWKELRELAADPLVTIGAHGVSHARLSELGEDAARAELVGSKRELEAQLGRAVRHFAFPFGGPNAAGAREFRLAREAGFATALTTRSGNLFAAHAGRLQQLPRLGVSGNYPRAVERLRLLECGLVPARDNGWRRVV